MTRLGEDILSGIELYVKTVKSDLEQILQTQVEATFFQQAPGEPHFDFHDYTLLENTPGIEHITFTEYSENPALLKDRTTETGEIKVCSHLLRSNLQNYKTTRLGKHLYPHESRPLAG